MENVSLLDPGKGELGRARALSAAHRGAALEFRASLLLFYAGRSIVAGRTAIARGTPQLTTNADINDLIAFYASPLGQAAARAVALALTPVWRHIPDERLVGLGYAVPYIDRFAADAERALAFMPAAQGAQNWPPFAASRTVLVGSEDLPLGDSSVDRILMVHSLEFAESPELLMAEAWRVLAPGGRIVVLVPHRRGVWARFEHTPWGSGRPWSRGQLTRLLRDAMFTPSSWSEALLFPPFRKRPLLGLSAPLERLGRDFWPVFAGVVIIEATKQLYRGLPVASTARERRRAIKPVLVPAGAGAGARICRDGA